MSLQVADLRISAAAKGHEREIASQIAFEVDAGEAIGIVGESGSGKSLSARALLDLLPPGVTWSGDIRLAGRRLAELGARDRHRLRGREIALVMQDPFTMLNPVERCGDQIVEGITDERGARLDQAARRREAVRRLRDVEIDDPEVATRYPFELSGGMRQRVAIAAAIAQQPQVLVADEPTTALDVTTQREILDLLARLRKRHGMGLVLITHDLRVAFSVCDRVYVMYAGSVVETAAADRLACRPLHPYTLGLLLADPPIDRREAELTGVPGSVPPPGRRPSGCVFAPRCRWAQEQCTVREPALRAVRADHLSRCVRVEEIEPELDHERTIRQRAAGESQHEPSEGHLAVVDDVRKVFPRRGRGGGEVVAVDGVSIRVRPGESVGLVGESGSGKTTLGRMLVGLETASSGRITVDDLELGAAGGPGRPELRRLRDNAQMVFQDPYSSLNPARRVGKTLTEALRLGGRARKDCDQAIASLLTRVGIPPDYAGRRPAQLSGGERQRIAIARTLARSPRLIVCDEVVSALDVSVQAQILNLLRSLQSELGLAYLFITHDLAVVRQVTDRIYVMRAGRVVEEGSTETILDAPGHPYTQRLIASLPPAIPDSAPAPAPANTPLEA